MRSDGTTVADSFCTTTKPVTSQVCNTQTCDTTTSSSSANFSARCAQAGVIRCESLDTLPRRVDGSVVMPIPTGYIPGNNSDPIVDTSIKSS